MLATARTVFALVVAFWPNQNSMVSNVLGARRVVFLFLSFFFGYAFIEECKISTSGLCFDDEKRLLRRNQGFGSLYYTCLTKFLLLVFRF